MTREEVLDQLRTTRAQFDAKVAAVSRERLDSAMPGRVHSPKQIVAHVSAYDDLMVERLRAARDGRTTAFERDRVGWEAFNDRVWADARDAPVDEVLESAASTFDDLIAEVEKLSDAELNSTTGIVEHLDPGWLEGRALWELIALDGFDHYPMHFEQLDEAAG